MDVMHTPPDGNCLLHCCLFAIAGMYLLVLCACFVMCRHALQDMMSTRRLASRRSTSARNT